MAEEAPRKEGLSAQLKNVKPWQWAVIGGIGIAVVGYIIKSRMSGSSSGTVQLTPNPFGNPIVISPGGGGSGGGSGGSGGSGGGSGGSGGGYYYSPEVPPPTDNYSPYQETQLAYNTPNVQITGYDGLGNPVVQGSGIFNYYDQLLAGKPLGTDAYNVGAVANPSGKPANISQPENLSVFAPNGQPTPTVDWSGYNPPNTISVFAPNGQPTPTVDWTGYNG